MIVRGLGLGGLAGPVRRVNAAALARYRQWKGNEQTGAGQ